MPDFIENLQIPQDVKHKLRSLGASSAPALLSLMQANPDSARSFLGDTVDALIPQLQDTLTPDDHAVLQRNTPQYALGAMVGPKPPVVAPPNYDIRQRDNLFSELERLRSDGRPSETSKAKIAELEGQLTEMLQR